MAAAAGLLAGLGGLTRYSFAWLIVPVLIYLIAFHGAKRAVLFPAALAGFLVVMAPWVARNYAASGTPFGTETFVALENSSSFEGDTLQRSLHPDLKKMVIQDLSRKLAANARDLIENDLPRLGGSWITALFLVGLLVPFRNQAISRLRWLLILGLLVFGLVQALGRPTPAGENAQISPQNMLVILAPIVFMYGVALFFVLLDSIALPSLAARRMLTGALCLVAALPLTLRLLPPHTSPLAYPPYYPPLVQRVSHWFNDQEMIMSDMPWAVAWYGRRQCLLTTLNWDKDFLEITDLYKPIKGLYLTPLTTDVPFLSGWIRGQNQGWANFLLDSLVRQEVPNGFPLRQAPAGFFPEQMLLTDYERWKTKKE